MPSIHSPRTPKYSSASFRTTSPTRNSPPPVEICAKINGQVHSNPALACATFDFAEHVRNRSYAMRNYIIDQIECATLLDVGVQALLPEDFAPSHPPLLDTFEILSTGKRGLGMFSCRYIPTGGLVLTEHPVVVVPYLIALPTPLSELYSKLFNRLPPRTFHDLISLSNCKSQEQGSFFEGIVRTNAIGVDLDVPGVPHAELSTHRAIFLNLSRCNHSCSPNAKWEWDARTFSVYLTAVRPLVPGEEITIQYISVTRSRDERQILLRSLYSFNCRCKCCTLLPEAAIHSDKARVTLDRFWSTLPSFEQWCLDSSLSDTSLIELHSHALELIEQEGLQVLDCEKHVDAITMCYGALEDVNMFRAWTGRIRNVKLRTDPSQAIVFAKWLSNPVAFPAWGWRKTFCGSRVAK